MPDSGRSKAAVAKYPRRARRAWCTNTLQCNAHVPEHFGLLQRFAGRRANTSRQPLRTLAQ